MDRSRGAHSVGLHSSEQWILESMETWMLFISLGPHSSIQKQGTSWAARMFLAILTQDRSLSGK